MRVEFAQHARQARRHQVIGGYTLGADRRSGAIGACQFSQFGVAGGGFEPRDRQVDHLTRGDRFDIIGIGDQEDLGKKVELALALVFARDRGHQAIERFGYREKLRMILDDVFEFAVGEAELAGLQGTRAAAGREKRDRQARGDPHARQPGHRPAHDRPHIRVLQIHGLIDPAVPGHPQCHIFSPLINLRALRRSPCEERQFRRRRE